MTDYYWLGTDSSNPTHWNVNANWSLSSGGSAASDHPKTNGDKAIFDTGSNACSMNISGGVVGRVDMTSGYTGTVTQASAFTIDNAGAHNGQLEINHANAIWNTNGETLTVDGPLSGNGTFTAGASTVTVTGSTAVGIVNITTGTYNYYDDFRPTTANITDNATFNQTSVGGQLGGRIIITASKTPTFNAVGRLHSSLDIQSGEQGNSTFNLDLSEPQTGPSRALFFHNLELDSQNTENNTFTMAGAITCTGNLTITDGIIDTSGSNHALTVTGDVSVTGTLTGNASAITIGKMLEITNGGTYIETSGTTLISGQPDGDYVLRNHDGGTYTKHATGILKIARTSASGTKYAKFGEDVYNDVKLENTSSGSVVAIVGVMNLAGDLTVVEGELRSYGGTGAIDVDGNVSIEDGGKFSTETTQLTAGGVNADFGSLTIASGGEYDATPLTTTITGETASHAWKNDESDGTGFVHNNGKVKIYDATGTVMGSTSVKENVFYDLEISLYATTYSCSLYDGDGSDAVTILNNLDVTKGEVEFSTISDTITIHGLTNITADAKFCDNAGHDTNKIIHNGLVTNLGTYNINDGTTVKLNGGIRQLGTLTVK